jgi:hypothetical protein
MTDTTSNEEPVAEAVHTFGLDARGRLQATDSQGRRYHGLLPMRLFPMTDPENWISVFDEHGQEVCCLDSIADLDATSAAALREALAASEFVPVIHRVVHISSNDPPCRWEVETDHGNTEFIINDEKDLRRISQWSVLIVDGRGVRYAIPDVRKLNAYGRRAVEWHV